MQTFAPQPPTLNLSPALYNQLVCTLTPLLPAPHGDSPEALRARVHAAIAQVAAMQPANANEADLAAQSIVTRAQAEDIRRLIRDNAHDVTLAIRLNAQYAAMMRTSLAVHASLMQVQAVRRKRAAIQGAADQDARTRSVLEQSMLKVADQDIE